MKNFPPSLRQIQDWHINYTLKKGRAPNVLTFHIALPDDIAIPVVEKAYELLIKKYSILRSSLPLVDGQIRQQVQEYDAGRFGIVHRHYEQPPSAALPPYKDILQAFRNIRQGPLIHGCLLKTRDQGYLFTFFIHHIIADYRSLCTLKQELQRIYNRLNGHSHHDPSPAYRGWIEYLEANNDRFRDDQRNILAYWRNELKHLQWHTSYDRIHDRAREAGFIGPGQKKWSEWQDLYHSDLLKKPVGECAMFSITGDLFDALHTFRTGAKLSTFITLLAGFYILALKLTGNRNVLVQLTYSDRMNPETRDMIGNLLGTVLLHTQVNEDCTFRQFAKEIYRSFFISVDKVLYNSESLESLKLTPGAFIFLNFITTEVAADMEYKPAPENVPKKVEAKTPLYCVISEFGNAISFEIEYHLSFYDSLIVKFMANSYFSLLRSVLNHPDIQLKKILSGHME